MPQDEGYSRHGQLEGPQPSRPQIAHVAKSGPLHERVAYPGDIQGPLDPSWQAALESFAHFITQLRDHPLPESPGDFRRVVDDNGNVFIEWAIIEEAADGRKTWYRIPGASDDDPDIDLVPDGGGVLSGGLPVEDPVTVTAGGAAVPVGEESRKQTYSVAGVGTPVISFSDTSSQIATIIVPMPNTYSGGDVAIRFNYYQSAAGSGDTRFGVQARHAAPGLVVPALSGAFQFVTHTSTAAFTPWQTEYTPYFSPQGTWARGAELHLYIQRDHTVAGNIAQDIYFSGLHVLYPTDRITNRPTAFD